MAPGRHDVEGNGQVTADIEVTETSPDQGDGDGDRGSRVVKAHLGMALFYLIVSGILGSIAAIQLAVPGFADGIDFLSYGRVTPMVSAAFLYGWLTLGFLAGVHYALPRLAGRPLQGSGMAYASGFAVALGVLAGILGIAFGHSEGRPLLEMPLYADALMLVGLVLAAMVATRNVAPVRHHMVPAQWYLLAATWWSVMVVVVGNVPGLSGFTSAMQTGFFRAGLTGFWFVAAGVGLVYFLVPRIVGAEPMAPSNLSALGFWSLALVWAMTGPVSYIYGPGPGWYETLGVAFAIALFVPVLIIVADFVVALRGQWSTVAGWGSLSYIFAGAFLFLLIPLHTLIQALRTSSAVVQFTEWLPAGDALAYSGAFSMWLFALYHEERARSSGSRRAAWHLRFSLVGVVLMVGAGWMAAPATGFTWAAGANAGSPSAVGDGWASVQDALAPYLTIRAIGVVVFALAQLWFLVVLARRSESDVPNALDAAPLDLEMGRPGALSWNRLRYGVVTLFLGAFLLTVVLPSFDPAVEEGTILGDRDRVYPEGSTLAAGRAIYLEEGCYYCHTQQVRPIVTDVGLGVVSEAGDYVHETPAALGVERLGPDLTHVGDRYPTAGVLISRLVDPRGSRSWSIMPSYDRLSDEELDALAEYLLSLR